MSKKILIISSSPRSEGNSELLCDQFLMGAIEAGHQAEKVSLRHKKIGFCLGCELCHVNGGQCVQKDDMSDILERMVMADVIVMATPVYFYSMAAQLKTMIDRTVPRYTEISNKEFYFIVTAADSTQANLESTIIALRGFTDGCLTNPIEKGILYAGGVWKKGDIKKSPFMQQAYKMGLSV